MLEASHAAEAFRASGVSCAEFAEAARRFPPLSPEELELLARKSRRSFIQRVIRAALGY